MVGSHYLKEPADDEKEKDLLSFAKAATSKPQVAKLPKAKICNGVDKHFFEYLYYAEEAGLDEIKLYMKNNLLSVGRQNNQNYQTILKCYNTYNYWGLIDPDNSIYDLIENRAKMLKEHCGDFLWLYERLADYRSRKTLLGIIENWLTFSMSSLEGISEKVFRHYFDIDVIKCDENEVWVNLGAYTGDTVLDYILTYRKYKKIYCYEIVPELFHRLKAQLEPFSNIEFRQKGAYSQTGSMYMSELEVHDSMHKISELGRIEIPTVTLDDDIKEPVSFINMDIEGAEQNALYGSRRHIQAAHPKLAISVYHNNEDIWKCARIIDEIDPTYKFYLRYNGGSYYPSEYVLLGV